MAQDEKAKLQEEVAEQVFKFGGRCIKALFRTAAHTANKVGVEKLNPVFEFFDEEATNMDKSLTDKIKGSFTGFSKDKEKMSDIRSKYEELKEK
ncbi:MAG: hypothetical protein II923_01510 [Campylobacter sp.]|nr:hypothetical protein [Campylobacter sp.]MBQ7270445.1 hypothetical protein [Campylobacter sp.]MBR0071107.1 hypothetical protein [Campylobacter sp.]